jgi:hypothetical protein
MSPGCLCKADSDSTSLKTLEYLLIEPFEPSADDPLMSAENVHRQRNVSNGTCKVRIISPLIIWSGPPNIPERPHRWTTPFSLFDPLAPNRAFSVLLSGLPPIFTSKHV